jgi:hypothetical protein
MGKTQIDIISIAFSQGNHWAKDLKDTSKINFSGLQFPVGRLSKA